MPRNMANKFPSVAQEHKVSMYTYLPHGRNELSKLTSLPTCGFIAQLVEHRTGIRGGHGFESVEALIFSGFSPIAQIGKLTVMIILYFQIYYCTKN